MPTVSPAIANPTARKRLRIAIPADESTTPVTEKAGVKISGRIMLIITVAISSVVG